MKFKYEIEGNRVIAYCNYAGKRLQASAVCADGDMFDANVGMQLAAKRLEIKIWNKRWHRAKKRHEEAQIKYMIALAEADDRLDYFEKVDNQLADLEQEYYNLLQQYS